MGLRQELRNDVHRILGDSAYGFGWALVVTDPDGNNACLRGFSTDIADLIDPETGQGISGRQAEVTISMDALRIAGLGHPAYIANTEGKPWVVKFLDIEGKPHAFKVMRSAPDRTAGLVLCFLEAYVA